MKNHREDSSSSLNNQHGEIPAEVRQYLEQHKIEPILTKAFNQVMRDLPIDPFGLLRLSILCCKAFRRESSSASSRGDMVDNESDAF